MMRSDISQLVMIRREISRLHRDFRTTPLYMRFALEKKIGFTPFSTMPDLLADNNLLTRLTVDFFSAMESFPVVCFTSEKDEAKFVIFA